MTAGAVILAAGAATRMGRIKQLLPYKNLTLVEHSIQQARNAGFAPLLVVMGANAAAVQEATARTTATSVVNENWQLGMGSSITCGVERMLALAPDLEAIAILLADQPYVLEDHLRRMKRAFESGTAPILAARYAGTLGVPAIFKRMVFQQLQSLEPKAGARVLLRGKGAGVGGFELPEAATDIDTPEDFSALE